jgi:hypothetical protein
MVVTTFATRRPVVVDGQLAFIFSASPLNSRGARNCVVTQLRPLLLLATPLVRARRIITTLRRSLRRWLRPSLRVSTRPKGSQRPSQRRLRPRNFADIPTPLSVKNIEGVRAVLIALSIFSASLALDSCAIASALARQRLSITSATEIASAQSTAARSRAAKSRSILAAVSSFRPCADDASATRLRQKPRP